MAENTLIGAELLKQNGISSGRVLVEERTKIRELLARDRKRVRLLGTVALVCFGIIVASPLVFSGYAFLRSSGYELPGWLEWVVAPMIVLMLLAFPAVPVGAITGLLWLFFSRSADSRAIQVHLAQVELLLRNPPRSEAPAAAPEIPREQQQAPGK